MDRDSQQQSSPQQPMRPHTAGVTRSLPSHNNQQQHPSSQPGLGGTVTPSTRIQPSSSRGATTTTSGYAHTQQGVGAGGQQGLAMPSSSSHQHQQQDHLDNAEEATPDVIRRQRRAAAAAAAAQQQQPSVVNNNSNQQQQQQPRPQSSTLQRRRVRQQLQIVADEQQQQQQRPNSHSPLAAQGEGGTNNNRYSPQPHPQQNGGDQHNQHHGPLAAPTTITTNPLNHQPQKQQLQPQLHHHHNNNDDDNDDAAAADGGSGDAAVAAAATKKPEENGTADPQQPKQMFEPGFVFRNRWKITDKIGGGAFGETYTAEDALSPPGSRFHRVCIKVEKQDKRAALRAEVLALKRAQECPHAVRYVSSGKQDFVSFLVMEKLGENLSEARRKYRGGIVDLYASLKLGISCIEAIEGIHRLGLVHRDIKPSNFVLSNNPHADPFRVYLIDFGLARRFKSSDGRVKPPRDNAGFRGTSRYASQASHNHKELGPVDDLWSLLFMIIEFITGTLPWRRLREKEAIGQMKESCVGPQLVKYLPRELTTFLSHLMSLSYESEPNYTLLKDLLQRTLDRKQCQPRVVPYWPPALDQQPPYAQQQQPPRTDAQGRGGQGGEHDDGGEDVEEMMNNNQPQRQKERGGGGGGAPPSISPPATRKAPEPHQQQQQHQPQRRAPSLTPQDPQRNNLHHHQNNDNGGDDQDDCAFVFEELQHHLPPAPAPQDLVLASQETAKSTDNKNEENDDENLAVDDAKFKFLQNDLHPALNAEHLQQHNLEQTSIRHSTRNSPPNPNNGNNNSNKQPSPSSLQEAGASLEHEMKKKDRTEQQQGQQQRQDYYQHQHLRDNLYIGGDGGGGVDSPTPADNDDEGGRKEAKTKIAPFPKDEGGADGEFRLQRTHGDNPPIVVRTIAVTPAEEEEDGSAENDHAKPGGEKSITTGYNGSDDYLLVDLRKYAIVYTHDPRDEMRLQALLTTFSKVRIMCALTVDQLIELDRLSQEIQSQEQQRSVVRVDLRRQLDLMDDQINTLDECVAQLERELHEQGTGCSPQQQQQQGKKRNSQDAVVGSASNSPLKQLPSPTRHELDGGERYADDNQGALQQQTVVPPAPDRALEMSNNSNPPPRPINAFSPRTGERTDESDTTDHQQKRKNSSAGKRKRGGSGGSALAENNNASSEQQDRNKQSPPSVDASDLSAAEGNDTESDDDDGGCFCLGSGGKKKSDKEKKKTDAGEDTAVRALQWSDEDADDDPNDSERTKKRKKAERREKQRKNNKASKKDDDDAECGCVVQ